MSVVIDTSELDRLVQQAVNGADDLADTEVAYYAVAQALVGDIRDRFAAEDFAALSARTIAARGPGARPLQDTMELFNAVTALTPGAEYSDFSVSAEGLVIGTDKPGAEEAEYGSIHEPQRQFMPTDDDYILRIAEQSGAIDRLMDKMARRF